MAKLIGNKPNQVPTNGDLGTMAYQDYDVVAPQFLSGGNRNLIINGAMQVAQRGTSVTAQSSGTYHTVDRFLTESNGATYDHSQSTTVPSGKGFSYSVKAVIDGAFTPTASQYFIPFEHRIEGQNLQHLAYGTSDAKSVTLSFWIRSSKTGTYVVEFSNFNSTQNRKYSKQYTINSADTWEYKTLTLEGDTVRSFDNTNGMELTLYWWMTAGTDYTSGTIPSSWENPVTANRAVGVPTSLADNEEFYLTGVQLEVGNTATPFEYRSYADELAKCQRYFIGGMHFMCFGRGYSPSSVGNSAPVLWPVTMRTAPTITKSNENDGGGSQTTMVFGSTRATGTNPEAESTNNTDTNYVTADITADAEL